MAVAIEQRCVEKHPQYTLIKVAIIRSAIALPLQRFWWHTKACVVVAGMLLLLGGSLIVLRFHSFYQAGFKRLR